jgi:large subunit ribosomal protein L35
MPKLKTKKGVSKRFKLTKKGKIKYHGGGKSHLQTNKSGGRVRKLRKSQTLANKKELAYLKKMLPYG